jgi:hypothetical protein
MAFALSLLFQMLLEFISGLAMVCLQLPSLALVLTFKVRLLSLEFFFGGLAILVSIIVVLVAGLGCKVLFIIIEFAWR